MIKDMKELKKEDNIEENKERIKEVYDDIDEYLLQNTFFIKEKLLKILITVNVSTLTN